MTFFSSLTIGKSYVDVLLQAVNDFSAISGLKVNAEKNVCFFGNVDTVTENTIILAGLFSVGKCGL